MRRICLLLVLAAVSFSFVGSGCQARKAEGDPREKPVAPAVDNQPGKLAPVIPVAQPGPNQPRIEPKEDEDAGKRDRYEAALGDALNLLGEKKYGEAMLALETAQAFHDTDFIKAEIAKLKARIGQEDAARKTLQEIEAILETGRGKEAAELADDALQQFGATDLSGRLVALKLQADALAMAQRGKEEDGGVRYQRLRDQGEAALKEKNLRAAALAFEQAVQAKEDARLLEQLKEIRAALEDYDDLRRKAAELRRDPGQLEEAIAALEEAAKAWDTLQVRQEIDEYTLALQKRRDRVSVADFEVRGEVGFPEAGRTVAEEVLPSSQAAFDLVERGPARQGARRAEVRRTARQLAATAGGRHSSRRSAISCWAASSRWAASPSTPGSSMCEPAWLCRPARYRQRPGRGDAPAARPGQAAFDER